MGLSSHCEHDQNHLLNWLHNFIRIYTPTTLTGSRRKYNSFVETKSAKWDYYQAPVYLWVHESHPEVQKPEVNRPILTSWSLMLSTTARHHAAKPRVCIEKYLRFMFTFLMEGSSMSSIMLMVTMAVLSWMSNMMERHTILITMDMEDMNKICDKL